MIYGTIIRREIKLIVTRNYSLLYIIALFIVMLVTATITLERELIIDILPNLLWLCSTFVLQISIYYNLFESDYYNGNLEQMIMHNAIPEFVIASKIFAHWLCLGLPISSLSILIYLIITENIFFSLWVGLLLSISSLVIIFISSVGHALVLSKNGGTAIAQVLVLPTTIPIIIYFNLLLSYLRDGIIANGLLLLGILIICLIPVSMVFIFFALKLVIEQD